MSCTDLDRDVFDPPRADETWRVRSSSRPCWCPPRSTCRYPLSLSPGRASDDRHISSPASPHTSESPLSTAPTGTSTTLASPTHASTFCSDSRHTRSPGRLCFMLVMLRYSTSSVTRSCTDRRPPCPVKLSPLVRGVLTNREDVVAVVWRTFTVELLTSVERSYCLFVSAKADWRQPNEGPSQITFCKPV